MPRSLLSPAKLYYFEGRGRAEQVRWLLVVAKIPFINVAVKSREDFDKLQTEGKLILGQLPVLEMEFSTTVKEGESQIQNQTQNPQDINQNESETIYLSQTQAIIRFLAMEYDLYGIYGVHQTLNCTLKGVEKVLMNHNQYMTMQQSYQGPQNMQQQSASDNNAQSLVRGVQAPLVDKSKVYSSKEKNTNTLTSTATSKEANSHVGGNDSSESNNKGQQQDGTQTDGVGPNQGQGAGDEQGPDKNQDGEEDGNQGAGTGTRSLGVNSNTGSGSGMNSNVLSGENTNMVFDPNNIQSGGGPGHSNHGNHGHGPNLLQRSTKLVHDLQHYSTVTCSVSSILHPQAKFRMAQTDMVAEIISDLYAVCLRYPFQNQDIRSQFIIQEAGVVLAKFGTYIEKIALENEEKVRKIIVKEIEEQSILNMNQQQQQLNLEKQNRSHHGSKSPAMSNLSRSASMVAAANTMDAQAAVALAADHLNNQANNNNNNNSNSSSASQTGNINDQNFLDTKAISSKINYITKSTLDAARDIHVPYLVGRSLSYADVLLAHAISSIRELVAADDHDTQLLEVIDQFKQQNCLSLNADGDSISPIGGADSSNASPVGLAGPGSETNNNLGSNKDWISEAFPKISQITSHVCGLKSIQEYVKSDLRYPAPTGEVGDLYVKNVNLALGRSEG